MIPTISQACSLHSDFATDLEEYAAAGCRSVEIWLTKLETYLEGQTIDDARALLAQHEIRCPVASYQGGLFQAAGPALDECLAHFRRRLELCSQLEIATLVVAVDITDPLTQQTLDELPNRANRIGEMAERHGTRIAFEFQPEAVFLNNLRSLAVFLNQLGRANLGICLDVMYFERSSSKDADLKLLDSGNLFHVQLSDFESEFRELVTSNDRILPGDGAVRFESLVDRLAAIAYQGPIGVEIHNPLIWAIPPRQFAEIALSSIARLTTNRST